jgi:hypothetical protein
MEKIKSGMPVLYKICPIVGREAWGVSAVAAGEISVIGFFLL